MLFAKYKPQEYFFGKGVQKLKGAIIEGCQNQRDPKSKGVYLRITRISAEAVALP